MFSFRFVWLVVNTNLRVNPYEGVSFCVELLFERDNNSLEILDGLVLDVVCHLQVNTYFIMMLFSFLRSP